MFNAKKFGEFSRKIKVFSNSTELFSKIFIVDLIIFLF